MGCTFSRSEAGNVNPRVFKVFNVDDQGQELNPGKIEISHNELILHQRGKEPIRWPLRCLRRYGFDAELFSFESGRRCPTGPGIYAFKCRRAEALFNLLQECIQRAGQEEQQQRTTVNGATTGSSSRPNSIIEHASTGALVPNGTTDLVTYNNHNRVSHYVNGDVAATLDNAARPSGQAVVQQEHEYVNTPVAVQPSAATEVDPATVEVSVGNGTGATKQLHYAELDLPESKSQEELDGRGPASLSGVAAAAIDNEDNEAIMADVEINRGSSQATYINVTQDHKNSEVFIVDRRTSNGTGAKRGFVRQGSIGDQHSYANLDLLSSNTPPILREPRTRRVNYVQLDLEQSSDSIGPNVTPASPISLSSSNPDSPCRRTDSYAMIDFHKTAALSNSAKNANNEDEGLRKTRHNSNIDDIY